jgi:hypothetical protein
MSPPAVSYGGSGSVAQPVIPLRYRPQRRIHQINSLTHIRHLVGRQGLWRSEAPRRVKAVHCGWFACVISGYDIFGILRQLTVRQVLAKTDSGSQQSVAQ